MALAHWFRPRSVWLPTWRTCLLAIALVGLLGVGFIAQVHPWLCLTKPLPDAKYLIVEGWTPDSVPTAAVQWAKDHAITRLFTTGTPIERGAIETAFPTYAEQMAGALQKLGIDASKITPAPASAVRTERTRAMARALRLVLDAEHVPAVDRRILLFTHSTHARRSFMHFARELGPDWQVGVVSVPERSYPADHWWRYSEGVKSVTNELLGIVVQSLGGE